MESNDDFILEFLPTRPTTLRSTSPLSLEMKSYSPFSNRILLASIRNLGRCPCPRCLVQLSEVHNIGMARDMQHRVTLARVDDTNRRNAVSAARKLIYDENHQVNSTAVERLLKGESWVPNTVCMGFLHSELLLTLKT